MLFKTKEPIDMPIERLYDLLSANHPLCCVSKIGEV